MDDDDLDLDAFIANVEQSAPQDEKQGNQLMCANCDSVLEMADDDGGFVCPSCSGQATHMMQLEETEIQYTEGGRAIAGQRVSLEARKKKPLSIDYGWAWSTDEAIVHILDQQIDALERLKLVPPIDFRKAVTAMYLKFWAENVATYIKDEYTEEELVPLEKSRVLKHRDIEVLVYSKEHIMVPKPQKAEMRVTRQAAATMFRRDLESSSSSSSLDSVSLDGEQDGGDISEGGEKRMEEDKPQNQSWSLNRDTVSILTLNRTLAFLLAAGHLLNPEDPLTATDIVRAVSQRLVPFFGAHKSLPEGMKLNRKDKKLFMKNKPPNPFQLSRAASLLVYKTYHDKLPLRAPRPNLGPLLQRFIEDMNLPHDLIELLDTNINFPSFKQTNGTIFKRHYHTGLFALYERWAMAILIANLKKLFHLDDESLLEQKELAKNTRRKPKSKFEKNFILDDWIAQISMRLKFIMTHDPYVLFHPMTSLEELQPTPQVYNYVGALLEDEKVPADIRQVQCERHYDHELRSELADFLARELPKPKGFDYRWPKEEELERATNIRHPLQDAFRRTQRFWFPEVSSNQQVLDLLFRDFAADKIVLPTSSRQWSIFDGNPRNFKFEISPDWPYCFRLLLSIGGYLCFCEPNDLLIEYRSVEEYVFPELYDNKKPRPTES